MIESNQTFRLTCDVCGCKTADNPPESMQTHIANGWKWHRYQQMPSYYFHLMVCSDACKERWESLFKEQLLLTYLDEIDLLIRFSVVIHTTSHNNPDHTPSTFWAKGWHKDMGEYKP